MKDQIEQRLQEIEAREKEATPGRWSNIDTREWAHPCVFVGHVPAGSTYDSAKHYRIAHLASTVGEVQQEVLNSEFIANARQDIPFLLALVKRQRETLQAIVDGAVHPEIAVRRVMVDLAPVHAAINFNPESVSPCQ